MKNLLPLFKILEIPLYIFIIGILIIDINVILFVLLFLISLFRLWININLK
jgi:hypothetical protein